MSAERIWRDFEHFAHMPTILDNTRAALGMTNGDRPRLEHFEQAEPGHLELIRLMLAGAKAGFSDRHEIDPLDSWGVLEQLQRMRDREAARRIFEAEQGPAEHVAEAIIRGDELAHIPEPGWLIERWLPAGSLTVAYGPKGNGKTFAVVDMALSIAHGRPFASHRTRQANVLYVVGEGVSGMWKRVEAWRQHRAAAGSLPVAWVPQPVNLLDDRAVSQVVEAAEGEAADLVVFDTLNRCMPGTDEGAADMGKAVAAADRLRDAGRAVLFVHHAGKDESKGSRGHTSLVGAADAVLKITGGDGWVRLACDWQKDDAASAPIAFATTSVGRSLVLVPGKDAAPDARPEITQAKAAVVAVRKLAEVDGVDGASQNVVLGAMNTIRASDRAKRAGIEMAVAKGWLIEKAGRRNARLYSLGTDIAVDE